jgi:hypothetical protein
MSTIVLLLMTNCVPGLDPLPVAEAAPSYNESGVSGRDSGSRHRFFGRIRGIFTRRSRGTPQSSPTSKGTPADMGAVTSTPTPAPAPAAIPSGAVSAPITQPMPVLASPGAAPAQRMPVGVPLQDTSVAKPY